MGSLCAKGLNSLMVSGEEFFCFFGFFKNKFIYLFIYFWLLWVFVATHELSLVAASRGYFSL